MEQGLRELEAAAEVLLAPPNCVTNDQRHAAEEVFMNFRKVKSPLGLCKCILDASTSDLVLFEAAGLLKDSLIREWNSVSEQDLKSLKTYLLNYVVQKTTLSAYVRERILQVVAIMVKRGSVEDLGANRGQILNDVEQLVLSGDSNQQMIACSVLAAIMQEYSSSVKSSDVGLRWEIHFRVKRQFEGTDLKRIFHFVVQALRTFGSDDSQMDRESCLLLSRLLAIAESVLSWFFVPSTMLPKRLIGVFEADQNPSLRPGPQWSDVFLEPNVVELFYRLHYKVRHLPDLCHHTLNCLTQLASLNGPVLANKDVRVSYVSHFLTQFVHLVGGTELRPQESLGVSSIFRKLVLFFPPDTLAAMNPDLLHTVFLHCTRLTCKFAEQAERESTLSSDDNLYMEAFDNMIIGWDSLGVDSSFIKEEWRIEILNTFIKCHLGAPEGIRGEGANEEAEEVIEETEEDDKTKFRDQLSSIGAFSRSVASHSLVLLARLLEDRITRFSTQLQRMHGQSLSQSDQHQLGSLFEDLHWLLLISGHTLTLDSDGETAVIPQEILQHSIAQAPTVSVETTLKVIASPGNRATDIAGMEETCDHVARLIAAVLRLCEVERRASDAGLAHLLSPEMGSTIVWWLRRFALTYMLPNENLYIELSPSFSAAFGRDSEGASWIIGFLLNKVESNLRTQTAEQALMNETLKLLMALVDTREKRNVVINSGPFWTLVRMHNNNELLQLGGIARRKFFQALTIAGAGANSPTCVGLGDQNYFWNQVLKPLEDRLITVIQSESLNRLIHQDDVRFAITTGLESLIGVAMGSQVATVQMLFASLQLVLRELPKLIHAAHNYNLIVELVLELLSTCARVMLIFLSQSDSEKLYRLALSATQAYATRTSGRITRETSAEEDAHRDLLLFMELLMNLLSKDIIDLSPFASEGTPISASEVCLHGLNLLMPLMNAELLRFPQLCWHYYKLITFACEICPAKIVSLPSDMLSNLFASLQLGMNSFGSDVAAFCFEFIQVLSTHLAKNDRTCSAYEAMKPFLKIVLEMILYQQISSDLLNVASGTFYALICAYQTEYQLLVEELLSQQEDEACRNRLVNAFNNLTVGVPLNADRLGRIKFRDNFDAFIMEVRSLLIVK